MAQPIITTRSRGLKVVSGLLVCMGLLLMLLPGAGASPPAQAQEPDVSAALTTITRNVSSIISPFPPTPCVTVTGSHTFNLQGTTSPPSQTVEIKATSSPGAWVKLRVTVTFNSIVPVFIYTDDNANGACSGGTSSQSSVAMSGSKLVETGQIYVPAGSGVQVPIPLGEVQLTGTKQVNVTGTKDVYIWASNPPIYGTATIQLLVDWGSATFPLYAYLPMIARQDTPAGGAWSDDFSSDRGWARLSASDVCDVGVDNGTLRVRLKKAGVCWISAPAGVFLAQGTFRVDAVRTSDAKGWFGLVFNATTSLLEQRWQLDAAPWDDSDGCGSGKARVKLSYKDGSAGGQWPICTGDLKRGKGEWNTLKVVRNGDNVKAYVNEDLKIEVNEGRLKDAGLFDLVVFSDNKDVEIRFDNFSITP